MRNAITFLELAIGSVLIGAFGLYVVQGAMLMVGAIL